VSEASWNTQKAVYAALTGASIAGGRVYDDVPDAATAADAPDSEFPYVQIGEMDATADDVSTSAGGRDDGDVETITLHVWSRETGQREVKNVMQAIKDLLHDQALVVEGRASALCFVRARRSFMDPDGRTRHGVITVEVVHRN
jgi:hypothetical protein